MPHLGFLLQYVLGDFRCGDFAELVHSRESGAQSLDLQAIFTHKNLHNIDYY